MTVSRIRKALIAVAGAVAQAVALGVLPPEWQAWGAVVVALATALGVYVTPNAPETTS
jgi:hypothetical protein